MIYIIICLIIVYFSRFYKSVNKKNTIPSIRDQNPNEQIYIKKSLKYKILFAIVPLFLIAFTFFCVTTYFTANKSITNIAKEFIGYKLKEVVQFSQEQGFVLESGNIIRQMRNNNSILEYAKQFTDELFIIIPYNYKEITNTEYKFTLNTNITKDQLDQYYELVRTEEEKLENDIESYNSWLDVLPGGGGQFVGLFIPYTELQSWFLLLVDENFFYNPVGEMMLYLFAIVVISLIILIIFVLYFVNFITRPLTYCVETIQSITHNMDFSKRVRILYPDEIGVLGQYFNNMIQELEKSYNQIKNYAYQTVLAKQKEEKIRFIFQKYVPSDVIDHVLNRSTDSMLVGVKQKVSVLFSDIRDFTTISEQLDPEELVLSLNVYFTDMVSQIMENKGIIDKFIGDAIMALFGAPAVSEYSADNALNSAIQMVQALEFFNERQTKIGKINFQVGIGINTGEAIVGNIGSDQKLEYTVIGDTVNLGARLEGLTKSYQVPILVSEFTKAAVIEQDKYLFINVDTVKVKGKDLPVAIYTPKLKNTLAQEEEKFYVNYHIAQQLYYKGDFKEAHEKFQHLRDRTYSPYLINLYIGRCDNLIKNPPTNWDGVETWKTK